MSKRILAALAMAAALGACRTVSVDQMGTVGWTHGYAVKPAAGSPAVLYVWMTNPTGQPDTARAVRMPAADSAQIHTTMAMGNGMEHMTPVPALAVPAHDTVKFAPGGLHIMVFGLDSTLVKGDSTQVTVTFARAGDVTGWAHVITYADVDSAVMR